MQVEAYVIFEKDAAADKAAVINELRSTSLQMCLQLVVGGHGPDIFVHLNCTEEGTAKIWIRPWRNCRRSEVFRARSGC